MKYIKIIFLISVLLFIESTCYSQYKKKGVSQLKIEPEIHDLGKIKEIDGVVIVKFVITNISKKPYILNYSYSGCGCVAAKISKKPLMPNEKREIAVTFNPKRRPGVFHQDISLMSNNKKSLDKLQLVGEVIPRPKSVTELYPVKAINGLNVSSDILPLGIISQNEKHIGVISYYNDSKESVNLRVNVTGNKLGVANVTSNKIEPNRGGQIHFSYNLIDGTYYGELKNSIELYINGEKWETSINVNALVVFNFFEMSEEERRMAPRAIISPKKYVVAYGERKEVLILNNGKSDLKILSVIPSGDDIKYELKQDIIEPNKTGKIILYIIETKDKLSSGDVTLMINSPESPIITIKLNTLNK